MLRRLPQGDQLGGAVTTGAPDQRRRVLAGARRPRRRQPQRADRRRLGRLRPRAAARRHRAAGLAGARRPAAAAHRRASVRQRARSPATSAERSSPRSRSRTRTATAPRRSTPPTSRARSTAGAPAASGSSRWRPTRASPASRCSPFVNSRHGETNRTQHGFIASPVLADLDGDADWRSSPRAWTATSTPGTRTATRSPASRCWSSTRRKVQSIDPQTHQVTFKADAGSFQQGAIVDTPAVARPDRRRRRRRSSSAPTRSTTPTRTAAGTRRPRTAPRSTCSTSSGRGSTQFKSACGSGCDDIPEPPLEAGQLAPLRDPSRRQRPPGRRSLPAGLAGEGGDRLRRAPARRGRGDHRHTRSSATPTAGAAPARRSA